MGLEVVVRPVVFPNIRPTTPRVLSPAGDPSSGLAVLSGGGGKFMGTSRSSSFSISQQTPAAEVKRQVDVQRVYQKQDDGTINKGDFIDVETMKKVKLGDLVRHYSQPPSRDNVETRETNKEIVAGQG